MTEVPPTDNVAQMLALGIAATDRGEYDAGLQLLRRVYQLVPPEKAPQGLSAYGLCVAKADKKNKAGAELAQKAIDLQFYEGRHWANLVRIYISAKNRRKAVEILETGLDKMRNDSALIRVREEIGYRKAPYFRFLARQHPLNKLYSRNADRVQRKAKVILIALAALAYTAVMGWLYFTLLE